MPNSQAVKAFSIGSVFVFIYYWIFRILVGQCVIYRHPLWAPTYAWVYVGGGILIQAVFVLPRFQALWRRPLLAQLIGGILHLLSLLILPGRTYMS